ncbi:MAG: heme biosynthesis HemY N-terminal domain-containing protein [bacterium]
MRFLFLTILVLLAAALFTSFALSEPGYVLLGYGKTSIELPLVDFFLVLLAVLLAIYLIVKLIRTVFSTPRRLRGFQQQRKGHKARKGLTRGLIDMAAGEWASAEKAVVAAAARSEVPLLNYLVAAHAAQQQEATERRDEHIRKAIEADPLAEVAVGLTQAELQIRQKQYEEALATLQHLEELAPKHKFVKKQLARLFFKLKDWQHLAELLPTLRKQGGLSKDELQEMVAATMKARMEYAAEGGDLTELRRLWGEVPKAERMRPELAAPYVRLLLGLQETDEAEAVLAASLEQGLDDRLLKLYSEIDFSSPGQAIAKLESWQSKAAENNPTLLMALARVSLQSKLWGKARSALEQSIALAPSAEAYETMARLQEETGDKDQALAAYRAALSQMTAS